MNAREKLDAILEKLPEERVSEVLDFAQFLNWNQERQEWQRFGKTQLARAYDPNEPEYTSADLNRGRNS